MKIILHHTFRSVKDNLGQLFVIVFTVTILTALFFATLSLRDVFYNLQLSMATRLPDQAQIEIKGDILSEYEIDDAIDALNGVEYVDKYLELYALLKTKKDNDVEEKVVLIEATDLTHYYNYHSKSLFYKEGIGPEFVSTYPQVWLSYDFAKENELSVGSEIELYISLYGSYQKFVVTYLFQSQGVFANTSVNNVMTDLSAFGDRGLLTNVYVKMDDDSDVSDAIETLREYLPDRSIEIGSSVDYEYIESVVSGNQKLITVMLFFVLALVLFILLSSYLVIYQKRTQELSVFKAVGASFAQCIGILVFEGLLYGVTGAVLGTVLGRFAMQIVQIKVIPNFAGAIRFGFYHYILSMLLGTIVSLLCASVPAYLLVKRSVRAGADKPPLGSIKRKIPLFIAFIVFLAVCVVIVVFYPQTLVYVCFAMIADMALSIYFGAPYLVALTSRLFSFGKGIVKLSSSSVRRNKNTASLSAIVGAVISFSFVAVSIVSMVIGAIKPYYDHFRCDYIVQTISESTDMIAVNNEISSTFGVEKSILLQNQEYETIADNKKIKYTLYALNDVSEVDYVATSLTKEESEAFATNDDMIILSYDLANRFGKKKGDEIELDLSGKTKTFIVAAIDQTITKDDRVCFILNKEKNVYKNSFILVISNKNVSGMDLYKDLSDKVQKYSCNIMYYKDWVQSTNVGITGIELLLRLLQILIGAVAFIGVVNITVSTLHDRKREYNIYFSTGLDGKKYFFLSLLEGIVFALSGGVIGLFFSLIINLLMPELGKLIDRYVAVSYFPPEIGPVVAVIMLVYVLTYVTVALRIRKNRNIERNIT